jgi:hypothetical protein
MRPKTLALSLLLASAAAVTPAFANWFSNPVTNTMLNVGSAPSPTPEQLRAIGDSNYAPRPYTGPYSGEFEGAPPPYSDLTMFEGKSVFSGNGTRLGYVLAVDNGTQTIDLQTPGGIAVAMPADLVVARGDRVVAPTVTRADVLAMARAQTGRTVSLNG